MSIQVLSAQAFRQRLAGLIDPDQVLPEEDREAVKQDAVRFCSTLASLFGDDLDRKTLWERIGNGLVVCTAKCGGDWEAFVNEILQYIKADGGKVAASKPLAEFLEGFACKPRAHRDAFLRTIEAKHFVIIVKARALWQSMKRLPEPTEVSEQVAADGFVDEVPEAKA
jgi:hypothetical protein